MSSKRCTSAEIIFLGNYLSLSFEELSRGFQENFLEHF